MEAETCFTVRYAETDQMGIVHHSNYPIWFETGRTDFLKNVGMPNSELERRGILLPLKHIDCSFKSPAKYEDEIIVKTKICKMTCVRIDFDYEIINGVDGKLLAQGATSHAWTDKSLKPLNIEKRLPELCKLLKEALEEAKYSRIAGGVLKNNPERAVELFKEGYNCSQAVLGAYCDELEFDFETALKLSASFGGGMGRLREVCGAVSSMFMVAGLKYGYIDPKDSAFKQKHYELIQKLSQLFKEKNGSIICRELLGLDIHQDNPTPEARTKDYYKKRPCAELVKCAAEIIDEAISINEAGL